MSSGVKGNVPSVVLIVILLIVLLAAIAYVNARRERTTFIDVSALSASGRDVVCGGANPPLECGNPSKVCVGPPGNSWCLAPNDNGLWVDVARNGTKTDGANQPVYHFSQDGNLWLNRSTMPGGKGGWVADEVGQLRNDVNVLKASNRGSSGDINVGGKMFFRDKSSTLSPNADNNTDPYYLEKVTPSVNESHLRLTINDDANESMQIWGNGCAAGDCGGKGMKSHHFRADGATAHRGAVVVGHPDTAQDTWGFNFGLHSLNPVTGGWSHFPWADGRNYLRGDTEVTGNLVVNEGNNDGSKRGINLWHKDDKRFGIWMGDTSKYGGKSLTGGPVADGDIERHSVRFGTGNYAGHGFVFQNDAGKSLLSIKGDDGRTNVYGPLNVKGAAAKMCLGDTCLDEAQLKTLLQVAGGSIGAAAQQQSLMQNANKTMDGSTQAKAAPSAKYIMQAFGVTKDGAYWINLPQVGPKLMWCIMNPVCSGGGWMLAMKGGANSTAFGFHEAHWTKATTLNPGDATRNAGDAKYDVFNVYPASDWLAVFPDVNKSGGDVPGGYYGGWTWVENNAVGSAIAPSAFFQREQQITKLSNGVGYPATTPKPTASPKFNASIWSTQSGFHWYGINYDTVQYWNGAQWHPVRWGFAWNNEADQGSNDVAGGIGLAGSSAGDDVGCCQSSSGVLRKMRFEWYVR